MDINIAKRALEENTSAVNKYLEKKYLPEEGKDRTFGKLYEAQRYSLLSGGKRIRPTLTLEFCRLFGGDDEAAMPFAAAVEMVHTYSLIHDDLPCMDDDDMRRGKLSNHKVFGEGYATLAGDGLLTDAFMECAMNPHVSGDRAAAAVGILSGAAGSYGMVKGQAIDMFGEENELSVEELVELHMGKTGAMICAAAQLGALSAGVVLDDGRMEDVTEYAHNIGLVFQIVDDVLDVTSSADVLGKNTGVDSARHKTTFMSFFTPEIAMEYAKNYTEAAKRAIEKYSGSETLVSLADMLCYRKK